MLGVDVLMKVKGFISNVREDVCVLLNSKCYIRCSVSMGVCAYTQNHNTSKKKDAIT